MARNISTVAGDDLPGQERITVKSQKLIEDEIRGLAQEIMLRQRYQEDGFGLESGFDRRERAVAHISGLKRSYGLTDADFRLVQNRAKVGSGERVVWQVFAKDGKGLKVRFFG